VVIEAILCLRQKLPDDAPIDVYIITTDSPVTTDSPGTTTSIHALDPFIEAHPQIPIRITRVQNFDTLATAADHGIFLETLLRWYLQIREKHSGDTLYVCLAGGFKTMSAAMQQTAGYFGAGEIHHIIATPVISAPTEAAPHCKREPATLAEIISALAGGHIHPIHLGSQSGWPQFARLRSQDYPLDLSTPDPARPRIQLAALPKNAPYALTRHIRQITRRAHNIAENFNAISVLPFPELAAWPAEQLDWLNQPLEPDTPQDQQWIKNLPKIDLHLHLGGFATHGSLLQQVRQARTIASAADYPPEPSLPSHWPQSEKTISLQCYMSLGDATGSKLLNDPGCLEKHCALLYEHLLEQNITYAEIRCSPANYVNPAHTALGTPWAVLDTIRSHFARHMRDHPDDGPRINLIIIATRRPDGARDHRSDITRHISLALTASEHWTNPGEPRIVAVDLAGYEHKDTRAHLYREDFTPIHRCGLALTIHAGENDDAEGIWQALFTLNTRRIGHALSLEKSSDLIRSIAARRIAIEMCPYANYQIKGYAPMPGKTEEYPLKKYLDQGIPVTINTDNPGISTASLTDNILFAARMNPDLTRLDTPPALRDNALLGDILPRALHRELLEETTFAATRPLATRFLGIINEECTPVGRVHWGLVYLLQLASSDTLHPRHELCDFVWCSPAVLATRPCEHWTTLALKLLPTHPAS
jgi:adenosine deaminase